VTNFGGLITFFLLVRQITSVKFNKVKEE